MAMQGNAMQASHQLQCRAISPQPFSCSLLLQWRKVEKNYAYKLTRSEAVYDLFMIYPIINPIKPIKATNMKDRLPPLLLLSRFNSS